LLLLLQLMHYCLTAQTSQLTKDTTRLAELNKLIEATDNDSVWPKYNEEMGTIALKLLDHKDQQVSRAAKRAYYTFFVNKGYLCAMVSDHVCALSYYSKAVPIAEASGDPALLSSVYTNISYIYNETGDITKSLEFNKKSLEFAEKSGDKKILANALNNMAFRYSDLGDVPKALSHYSRSLKLREELKDTSGISESLNNIAALYYGTNDFTTALKYYRQSLALFKKKNDVAGQAFCYNNIGAVYRQIGKVDSAMILASIALKLREQTGNKGSIAASLSNVGAIYNVAKNYDSALVYYQRALAIHTEIGNKRGICMALHNLSNLFQSMGKTKDAIVHAERSLAIAREIGFPELIRESSRALYKAYEESGNYKGAHEMHKLFVAMRDSVSNESNRKSMIRNQFQYAYEKKEVEIKAQAEAETEIVKTRSEEEKKQQRLIIYAVTSGLILTGFLAFFIFRSLQQNKKAKKIIEEQKELVEEKQKEILDSINYAEKIQKALFGNKALMDKNLKEGFVYFKPKDIVSGDFYWATEHEGRFYLAACDSTGHGVPGAFMCLLNMGFLSEAIKEKKIIKPNEVFNYVRQRLIESISSEQQKDGMDGILICIDANKKRTTYAAAYNAPLIVRGDQIVELPADKMPVGKGERSDSFTEFELQMQKGDNLYLYTDGFADQFGGAKGKKFKYKQLNDLLVSVSSLSAPEKKEKLKAAFDSWKGDLDQVDDVLVIGLKMQ
jgi:serine phosphatase RsbU (regulator of sigma subunit)/Tfp pilus assembly protein PilF